MILYDVRLVTCVTLIDDVVDFPAFPMATEVPDGPTQVIDVDSVHLQVFRPQHLHIGNKEMFYLTTHSTLFIYSYRITGNFRGFLFSWFSWVSGQPQK